MSKTELHDIDHGWRDLFKRIQALRGSAHVKVGVLADSERGGLHQTDPDTGKASPLTVAEIAAVNEFGTEDGRIPARPAFRDTFDRLREELVADATHLLAKVLLGEIGAEEAPNVLGLKLATEIKKTITAGDPVKPENAPSTKKRKEAKTRRGAKFGVRTLVDTGREVAAISWALVFGDKQGDAQYVSKR